MDTQPVAVVNTTGCSNCSYRLLPADPVGMEGTYLEDLNVVMTEWTEDKAFYPTVFVYGIAFVFGVLGNGLVVFSLLGDRKSHNVTSSFLVSLAVADLLFLLICVPYDVAAKLAGHWAGGLVLCKMSGFVEMLSAQASIINLQAVSAERYCVIVHPMKARSWFTMRKVLKMIAAVWGVAILLSSPQLHAMGISRNIYHNNTNTVTTYSCIQDISPTWRILFSYYQFLVMFILPVLAMLFCYTAVIRVLWASTKQLAKMTQSSTSPLPHQSSDIEDDERCQLASGHRVSRTRDVSSDVREARKQVIKMLLTIITIFLICWGPKLILSIMKKHALEILYNDSSFYVMLCINLLPYLQSSSNPVIYWFMSANFRRALKNSIRTHCQRKKEREQQMMRSEVTINGSVYVPRGRAPSTTQFTQV